MTQTTVRKLAMIASLAVIMVIGSALPSLAAGVWDPNDTAGRLDIRWVGLRYTSADAAIVTVVLYPNFRRWALPGVNYSQRALEVEVDAYTNGYFFRKSGKIRFSYGDHGSDCCQVVAVHEPSHSTLVARIRPYPFGDEGDPGADVWGWSTFMVGGEPQNDRTREFHMPPLSD